MNTIRTDILEFLLSDSALVALLGGANKIRHHLATEDVLAPFLVFDVTPDTCNAHNGVTRDVVTFTSVDVLGNPAQTARAVVAHLSDTVFPLLAGHTGDSCVLSMTCVGAPEYSIDETREQLHWTLKAVIEYKN